MHYNGVTSKVEYDAGTQHTVATPMKVSAVEWAHKAAGAIGLCLDPAEAVSVGNLLVTRYSHHSMTPVFRHVMGCHHDVLKSILRLVGYTSDTIHDRNTERAFTCITNFHRALQNTLIVLGKSAGTADSVMKLVYEL